jgi:hypothetical protein
MISLTASLPLCAQSFRGSLVGTVIDQSGAAVPAAPVVATNQATGVSRSTTTDPSGNYSIPELPIGNYTVSVTVEGFTPVTQADVRVDVAAERRVDITLSPAKQRLTMEVRAEAGSASDFVHFEVCGFSSLNPVPSKPQTRKS